MPTTELARQLGLAPRSGLSPPLAAQGGWSVEPHRRDRRVYYRLSCAGETLLGIFGETD